jgi:outer membrane protein assembly factor BamD (BamD/ComL family)
VSLISEMQVALRAGETARVLSLVEEHERLFPASAWTPEREGARVLAACPGKNADEARSLGQSFLAAHPQSPLGARVRVTCGLR